MRIIDKLKFYLKCERGFFGPAAAIAGGAIIGGLSGGDQRSSQSLDPATQRFLSEHLRPGAIGAAQQLRQMGMFGPESFQAFMNPYQQQVIDQLNMNFDRSRDQALTAGSQAATQAGALGGSRQAILQSQLAGEVERARGGAVAGQLQQGFGQANQLAAMAHQMRQQGLMAPLQALQAGIGPGTFGTQTTTQGPGLASRILTGAAGGAQFGFGLGMFGGGGGGGTG